MKNQYGWVSEYRKNKFYENQKLREEKRRLELVDNIGNLNNKSIAVMLDLEGTVDNIDDEKAKQFIKQLNFLRTKFGAKIATISISTHYNNSNEIKKVLDIFSRNLSNCIRIGICFYHGGTYDYKKNKDSFIDYNFNQDKVKTFCSHYVNSIESDNQWFAIVDDGINDETYKKYQNTHPMLLARPSQRENCSSKNNFMSIATETKGFDGVIEIFNEYIKSIRNLSPSAVLGTQRKMITHLSKLDLSQKVYNRDYAFLEKYFREGCADESDYNYTLPRLINSIQFQTPSKEELIYLKRIIKLIYQHFNSKDEQEIAKRILKL